MIARGFRVLIVASVAVALCGCVPEPTEPPFLVSGAPTTPAVAPVDPRPTDDEPVTDVDCPGDVAYLSGHSTSLRLSAPCARVEVAGESLRVDLSDAVVGALTIRGEGITVSAGSVTSALIEGQRNMLTAASVGSGTVRGDGNTVDVLGDLGSLTVQGSGNTVTAAALGAVTDQGEGNAIAPRLRP